MPRREFICSLPRAAHVASASQSGDIVAGKGDDPLQDHGERARASILAQRGCKRDFSRCSIIAFERHYLQAMIVIEVLTEGTNCPHVASPISVTSTTASTLMRRFSLFTKAEEEATISPVESTDPSNITEGTNTTGTPLTDSPPDGGYGWVCCGAVALLNAFTWGIAAVRSIMI